MAIDDTGTELVITPSGGTAAGDTPVLAPFSARGLTQSLERLPGIQRRTINGELIDLTPSWNRKYKSTITCTDTTIPALDGAYIGQTVTVDCTHRLTYPTGGSPEKTVVSGSEEIEGAFVSYRPQLEMIVTDIRSSFDEAPHEYAWQCDLAEV